MTHFDKQSTGGWNCVFSWWPCEPKTFPGKFLCMSKLGAFAPSTLCVTDDFGNLVPVRTLLG